MFTAQIPIVQQCAVDAACQQCTDLTAVVINNGRAVTTTVNRVLRSRFRNTAADPAVDVCCNGCQPIIGSANTQGEPAPEATCAITCDMSQNSQNAYNLANLGNLAGYNGYSTQLNLGGYGSLGALGGLGGLGGFGLGGLGGLTGGLNPFLFDDPVNSNETSTEIEQQTDSSSDL